MGLWSHDMAAIRVRKKLEFQPALGTSSSQILLALGKLWLALLMLNLADDLLIPCSWCK